MRLTAEPHLLGTLRGEPSITNTCFVLSASIHLDLDSVLD